MDIPDWLRGIDENQPAAPAPSIPSPQPTPSSNDLPSWFQNLDTNQPAAPSSQPKTALNQPVPASVPQPQAVVTPPMPPVTQSQPLATQQSAVNQPAVASPQSVAATSTDPLGGLGKSVQEQDDAMAWLESLAAKHGAKSEELVTDPNPRTDVAPDWVDKAKTIGETSTATAPAPAINRLQLQRLHLLKRLNNLLLSLPMIRLVYGSVILNPATGRDLRREERGIRVFCGAGTVELDERVF